MRSGVRAVINGIEIEYLIDGPPTAPAVLLSHSLAPTLSMWKDQGPALARDFRVIRYHMRGDRRSGGAPPPPHFRLPAAAVGAPPGPPATARGGLVRPSH